MKGVFSGTLSLKVGIIKQHSGSQYAHSQTFVYGRRKLTYTLKGSLGSEVKVILKVTFDVALQYMYIYVYIISHGHTPCEQGVATGD